MCWLSPLIQGANRNMIGVICDPGRGPRITAKPVPALAGMTALMKTNFDPAADRAIMSADDE
jgi:hypothetical protein